MATNRKTGNLQGDSFQLVVDPADALVIALLLKATIKQHKALDVRMAIGIVLSITPLIK
jgi:hypothetical protein